MGRINAVLDEEVNYGFEGGGEYKTNQTDLENGFSDEDSAWKYPRHRYNAKFSTMQADTRTAVIQTFHACRGKRHEFMFKDWNDFEAEHESVAVEAGTTNKIQLYKTYLFGQAYTIRPIFALKDGTCSVYDEDDNLVPGTFNLLTGEFTPTNPWQVGKLYYWSGEFYVWVAFKDDYNGMTINGWQAYDATIELVERRTKITATNVPNSWEE